MKTSVMQSYSIIYWVVSFSWCKCTFFTPTSRWCLGAEKQNIRKPRKHCRELRDFDCSFIIISENLFFIVANNKNKTKHKHRENAARDGSVSWTFARAVSAYFTPWKLHFYLLLSSANSTGLIAQSFNVRSPTARSRTLTLASCFLFLFESFFCFLFHEQRKSWGDGRKKVETQASF